MTQSNAASPYVNKPWLSAYAKGVKPEIPNIPYENIGAMISSSAQRFSARTAFYTCLPNGMQGHVSFAEVESYSNQFAAFLIKELQLQKGDRVAIQMPNCIAYPIALFGILKAGCVVVNVNPLYTDREMEHAFNDSGATVLIIIDMFADKLPRVLPKTGIKHVITVSLADFFPVHLKLLIKTLLKLKKQVPICTVPHLPFPAALAAGQTRMAQTETAWARAGAQGGQKALTLPSVTLDDLAALQYTGGTTGVSKGAMLTHRNLLSNVYQILEFAKTTITTGEETIITALPLYHIFAFSVNCLSFFEEGATNVLIPSPRPMSNLKKPFEKHQITWMTGVNTLFNALTNEPWFVQNPPKKMKMSIAGGAALLSSTAEKWAKTVGTAVVEGYGLTESSPVLTFNPIGGKVKKDGIGVPMPSTEIRLVDDNGKEVGIGEPGELIARGPQIMAGYWKRAEETAKTIKDGWLCTGDVAVMDADGFFKIVDRKKDMILVSGFNVYPNEVEDCIAKHPEVVEVAVIGIPDGQSGEAVKAYVVPRSPNLTQDALRAHCKEMLTAYKVPRVVEFRKELPKTPIGKILRKDLRAEFLAQQQGKNV
ncbi:MAG: AMP-binding protein [Betaproteobacteria bacterium]|nr:AMP-binding protein [Betaproteobacteria bacterium]